MSYWKDKLKEADEANRLQQRVLAVMRDLANIPVSEFTLGNLSDIFGINFFFSYVTEDRVARLEELANEKKASRD